MSVSGINSGLLKSLFLGLLVVLLAELTFRVLVYGPRALNPFRMDSINPIWYSGLVKISEHPDVYYELKPDLDEYFRMARLVTNSAGLPDKEYSLEKPRDTSRIAVVGSSWTMPSGIPIEAAYHSVLEETLNRNEGDINFEVINFGLENYGLHEMVATVEHRVLPYAPDLILFALTIYTTKVKKPEENLMFIEEERQHPAFQLLTLRYLNMLFDLGLFEVALDRREIVETEDEYRIHLTKYMQKLSKLASERGIPVLILWLGWESQAQLSWWTDNRETGTIVSKTADQFGLPVTDASQTLRQEAAAQRRHFELSRWDRHPNAVGHQLIADAVYRTLVDKGLLATVATEPRL